jgi:hypothetical protein
MKRIVLSLIALGTLAGAVACTMTATQRVGENAKLIDGGQLPPEYRDWKLISVAREEGDIDDVRAILGNDTALEAYRTEKRPFPEGTIISRIAWSYEASEVNNNVFGRRQSFVAGHPKNGVQFMIKDSVKYASTGGWGYFQFDDGKPTNNTKAMQSCFPCHAKLEERDYVFTNYAR